MSCQTSVLDSFKASSGTGAAPHVLLDFGAYAANGLPAVLQEVSPVVLQEVSPLQVVICLSLFKIFLNINTYLFLVQNILHGTTIPILILRL